MNPEEAKELQHKIEAILFSSGRAVTLTEISSVCATPPPLVIEAIKHLKHNMEERESPLLLIEETNAWKLTVREKYLDLVRNITPHTELDKATLETLAIIAWKQPVMQAEVIKIRTSAAYEHITQLVTMGFVAKEKKGRSYVLKTTGRFFDYFDLPGKEALKEMLKGIEGNLQTIAEKEGVTGQKLGTLDVYTIKDEKQMPIGETAGMILSKDSKEDEEEKIEVYETQEEGEEDIQDNSSTEQPEQNQVYPLSSESDRPSKDEEETQKDQEKLSEEKEESEEDDQAKEEEEPKPQRRLASPLESFIADENKEEKKDDHENE